MKSIHLYLIIWVTALGSLDLASARTHILAPALVQPGKEAVVHTHYGLDVFRIVPDENAVSAWPYLLYYDPNKLKREDALILLVPPNTGQLSDYYQFAEVSSLYRIYEAQGWFQAFLDRFVFLVPVIPRPSSHPQIYTHALDRDSMLTAVDRYQRIDLQVIHMLEDARAHLQSNHAVKTEEKVGVFGFSASAQFANRFACLHPDRVRFVVAGGLSALPILPLAETEQKRLRYPLGVADVEALTGRPFQAESYRHVPQFLFMGEQDRNDSVRFSEAYDPEDRALVFDLLSADLMERWRNVHALHQDAGYPLAFHTYAGLGHSYDRRVQADFTAFIKQVIAR